MSRNLLNQRDTTHSPEYVFMLPSPDPPDELEHRAARGEGGAIQGLSQPANARIEAVAEPTPLLGPSVIGSGPAAFHA